jgi:hypothetical protein
LLSGQRGPTGPSRLRSSSGRRPVTRTCFSRPSGRGRSGCATAGPSSARRGIASTGRWLCRSPGAHSGGSSITRNVANVAKPTATSTPAPTPRPTATPKPTPVPTESPTPTSKQNYRQHESNTPFDDDNGKRIWHQVDGKWKWYPANKHHAPAKKGITSGRCIAG